MPHGKLKMVDIIAKKRNGGAHGREEICFIVNGIKDGSIPDHQLSAWLMAVYFKGMNLEENTILTDEMANSGEMLDLSEIGEHIIDKHSTGGVGDKTTLVLIPLLAAAGLPVAKLSGRGLGHTGGTIDKLESMPGFKTSLSFDEFLLQIKKEGLAIAGQTESLVPADKALYALRDVTATIDSIPLIAASVMSKKIAAGANIIIIDVKCGSGAFIKTLDEARELSSRMVEIGKRLNRSITTVITSMDQPLGFAVGNGIEVIECIDSLKGKGPADLTELSLYLGAIALVKTAKASGIEEGKDILRGYILDGSALRIFERMIISQGGDPDVINNYDKLAKPAYIYELKSKESGFISKVDALIVAKACKLLGTGRERKEDKVEHSTGIILNKKIGDKVEKGETLAKIYSNSENLTNLAVKKLKQAFAFSDKVTLLPDLIYEIIE